MVLLKRSAMLVCLFFLLLLAACNDKLTKTEGINPSEIDESKAGETDDVEVAEPVIAEEIESIPFAARTVEEIVVQNAGMLVEMHMDQQLETLEGFDHQKYQDYLKNTFNPIVEKEIKSYFSKHKNLSSEQVYDYLVHLLGSGNYKSYYEQLVSYEHGYEMVALPDGEDEVSTKQKKMNVIVLMDASGSMKGEIAGQTKMELAKAAIARFVEQILKDANVSLIAYGHVGSSSKSDKAASCSTVESVYSLSTYQADKFTNALHSFEARGWTPLAGAINKAGEILEAYPAEDYMNIVYMVSDGVETCDGDPVAAAKNLQNQQIKAKVNIIGFDVDNEGQQQLKKVADSGGGEYITVNDPAELEIQMIKKWQPSIGQLVWTQGVTIQQSTAAKQRMNEIYNPLYRISVSERNRIQSAVYFLEDEELLSNEIGKQVRKMAESIHELRSEHFQFVKEEKEAEREQAKEEIDRRVDEWKQRWKE